MQDSGRISYKKNKSKCYRNPNTLHGTDCQGECIPNKRNINKVKTISYKAMITKNRTRKLFNLIIKVSGESTFPEFQNGLI